MRAKVQIGFGSLAFLILFVLKIIGQTDMHWFWVLTSWIWVPVVAMLAGMFFVFCFGALAVAFAALIAKL